MQRCCQAVVGLSVRPSDSVEERNRKAIWVPLMCVLCFLAVVTYFWYYDSPTRALVLGLAICSMGTGTGAVYPLVRRDLPHDVVGPITVALAFGVILMDLSMAARSNSFRPWAWIILLMDVLLALGVPRLYQLIVIQLLSVWIVVDSVEHALRLGLYDIEGFSEDGSRAQEACNCADPPCALGLSIFFNAPLVLTIVHGDFFATRGFAEGLRKEQAKVQASVNVAEQVAADLAGFDLAAAGQTLNNAGSALPVRLSSSLHRLLANLASYRPYLPESCFEEAELGAGSGAGSQSAEQLPSPIARAGPHTGGDSGANLQPSHSAHVPTTAAGALRTDSGRSLRSERSFPQTPWSPGSGTTNSFNSEPTESAVQPQPGPPPLVLVPTGTAVKSHTVHAPQQRNVSLLTRNRSGFLAAAQLGSKQPARLGGWLAEEVDRFSSIVRFQGGVTDLLAGDHFSATFGALKAQGSHRISATRAAVLLGASAATPIIPTTPAGAAGGPALCAELPSTAAVCSGRALCGDFGSHATQRFMVIGGVSSFAAAAERCAAAWGVAALIDSVVHTDVEQFWSCRLCKLVRFPKVSPAPIRLWEVTGERMGGQEPNEWMYELQGAAPNVWERYNAAVGCWCSEGAAAALVIVDDALGRVPGGEEAPPSLLLLRERLQGDAPPPDAEITAAAFAGEPAPSA